MMLKDEIVILSDTVIQYIEISSIDYTVYCV